MEPVVARGKNPRLGRRGIRRCTALDYLGPELRERDDSLDQIPPQDEYDITKGSTYLYFGRKPQFTFGHVFSYTTFRYSELKMTPAAVAASGTVTVSLELQNTGAR
ncbi:MAG: Beta-glucosidase [Candidatus Solibacter sp.]|nr:Beta-glucosidase [Candidatus Solibacter sp.]